MKTLVATVAVAFLITSAAVQAADSPRGELLELHSCQVYIGGCVASSEFTQGQYLLRVWRFTSGTYGGVSLNGQTVALLEASDENMALRNEQPTESMVYIPQSATPEQTSALIGWLKTTNRELLGTRLQTRVVHMKFTDAHSAISFSAGDSLQIETQPFAPCGLVSCGEALWYTPRSKLNSYTVAVTSKTVVREPGLSLLWIDHGKNDVFVGSFGEDVTTHATFIPPVMTCSVADHPQHERSTP